MESEKLEKLVNEHAALGRAQQSRQLTREEQQRLDFLREVLLEAGAVLDSQDRQSPARLPRAPVSLEVSFGTTSDAARAWTRDIGVGGLAIATNKPLPKGSMLRVQVHVPGWLSPLVAAGEVVWTSADGMGIAFRELGPLDDRRLKQLLAENTPLLGRLSRLFAGSGAKPVAAKVSGVRCVLLQLADEVLADVTAELLGLNGFAAFESLPADTVPEVVVSDLSHLQPSLQKYPGIPTVAVNASSEAVLGRQSTLRPAMWVKRPASAAKILEAVRAVAKR